MPQLRRERELEREWKKGAFLIGAIYHSLLLVTPRDDGWPAGWLAGRFVGSDWMAGYRNLVCALALSG